MVVLPPRDQIGDSSVKWTYIWSGILSFSLGRSLRSKFLSWNKIASASRKLAFSNRWLLTRHLNSGQPSLEKSSSEFQPSPSKYLSENNIENYFQNLFYWKHISNIMNLTPVWMLDLQKRLSIRECVCVHWSLSLYVILCLWSLSVVGGLLGLVWGAWKMYNEVRMSDFTLWLLPVAQHDDGAPD